MTDALRQYYRVRGGSGSPLVELRVAVRENGLPQPGELPGLAEKIGLPVAALRSALSYYADLHRTPGATRVCQGTSCMLAGADDLIEALGANGACNPVYCLGYCDRSPAILRADDRPVVRCTRADLGDLRRLEPPDPPPMRCAAERPIVTRRAAKGDFADLEAARAEGAYDALEQALAGAPDDVLRALEDSGERGRGGAGFPTGRKWRAGAEAAGELKYVIANGDEGDPGSFIDRVLMERDPHAVLEGLALCAWAVGAAEGIVYVRCEYPEALRRMQEAVAAAEQAGMLGPSVLGSSFCFRVTVFPGMGSYVCGEETAMLNAIEGFRGEVRLRPPYPTESGLHGRPTIVNNVETLVNVPWIVANGARAYSALGTQQSSGTKAMCLNHGFARPGIVEVEFGMTLRELIETHGGGSNDAPLEAVILGGPMGSVLPPDRWDVPICYGAMQQRSIRLGHGGLVALPEGTDFRRLLVHWLEFMQRESCGKCVPCRIGSKRALELARSPADRSGLQRLLEVMTEGSLCAFGQLMPGPMDELLEHFGDRIFGDAS